jgi:hypothetical protein
VLEKIELDKSISKQEYKSLAKQLRRELSGTSAAGTQTKTSRYHPF